MSNPYPIEFPHYQAPTASIILDHTVAIQQNSEQSEPGIGSVIAREVSSGVQNSIVDDAINSSYRSSSYRDHTHLSAPVVETPTNTGTHTTNNYYYHHHHNGSSDSGENTATSQEDSSASVTPTTEQTLETTQQTSKSTQSEELHLQNTYSGMDELFWQVGEEIKRLTSNTSKFYL